MGRSRHSISRLASPFALMVCAALLGCYKPNIVDGGLKCNLDAGTGKSCPEGFKCDLGSMRCYRNPDGGVDRASDVVDGPVDMAEDMRPDVTCFEPRANCTPAPVDGGCDPFCQSGCGMCRNKCSVNTQGTPTCNNPTVAPPQTLKTVMQICSIESEGLRGQADDCAPGLVCMTDNCSSRCFQFCRADSDCTEASCTRDIPGGQKVCEVPYADCVPLPGTLNTGCGLPGGGMSCYLSSARPAHTICDCPFGAVPSNGPCTRSRDCIRGLTCVDRGGATPVCLQVCRLSDMGVMDCPSHTMGSCRQYFGAPAGTTMNTTYGYCF